ncbi:hypothetical protein D6817_05360, partial [Candidatus Pacearchaeota archaeon]
SGSFVQTQTSGPPGQTGFYSATINAYDGELVVVYSANGTYEGNASVNLLEAPSVTLVNLSLDTKIVPVDVEVNSSDISFDNSTLIEGHNVTVSVNVRNTGRADVYNVVVQIFDGDPGQGGSQIGSNRTIDSLGAGNSSIVNFSEFVPALGPNTIVAIVDPPLATNGSIEEDNETNNNASAVFDMPAYQVLYGNVYGDLIIADNSSTQLSNWTNVSSPEGNIFVADSETTSGINFGALQALGKGTNGGKAPNDFSELDSLLNMSNFADSIANLYTSDGSTPRQTRNFIVFNRLITDVPIINSTNTTYFVTGILWDTSDDSNGQFDTSEQEDVVFITEINHSQAGAYGTYDYEIKYPVLLRSYYGPDKEQVNLYVELT